MGGVYGTQQSQDWIVFIAKMMNGVGLALEDGKFKFLEDIGHFSGALFALVPAVEGSTQVPLELGELDAQDRGDIQARLEQEFTIPQERTEEFVEDTTCLAFGGTRAISVYEYVNKYFVGPNRIFKK